MEVFLRFLQKEYQWSTNSITTASSKLAKDDITSVKLLAMSWSEVRQHFPAGMSRMIEETRHDLMNNWVASGHRLKAQETVVS